MRTLVLVAAAAAAVALGAAAAVQADAGSGFPTGIPTGWTKVSAGPAGGAVWEGQIPNRFATWDHRPSAIYLPPGYDPSRRYPVLYLLHGMQGNPSEFFDALHIAAVSDGLITSGRVPPYIAVMPVAGPTVNPNGGEWAGIWESYVVRDVVPWVDAHLPTVASPQGRALEGLCAGGYGAVDIGLRHPGLFGTLGSWDGYFAPVFRDGPFVGASPADLAAHDPALLVRREAPLLRRERVRFYVSVGGNHGAVLRAWSLAFSRELSVLRLQHTLWTLPGAERGHFWGATLPSALTYAASAFRA